MTLKITKIKVEEMVGTSAELPRTSRRTTFSRPLTPFVSSTNGFSLVEDVIIRLNFPNSQSSGSIQYTLFSFFSPCTFIYSYHNYNHNHNIISIILMDYIKITFSVSSTVVCGFSAPALIFVIFNFNLS